MKLVVQCPAKLNTFLSVGPPDERAYHPLRTVFQAISLFDTLTIQRSDRIEFSSNDTSLVGDNSVLKAARLLAEVADYPPVKVHLEKRIPSGAGLGGGSSDSAAVLWSAKHLMRSKLSAHEEKAICRALGSDVPFFLVGGRAIGEGYGEILTPLDDPLPTWYVVAKPEQACATAGMYKALDEKPREWRELDADAIYNDFERVAPCESLDLLERLHVYGALQAGLTGSGSAVFGQFPTEQAALLAQENMRRECPFAEVARALPRAECFSVQRLD